MERWLDELDAGRPDAERYRRLLFASIHHYVRGYDDVMDAFTRVCGGLREKRSPSAAAYATDSRHHAKFSTWLVVVVRNLRVDWLRERHGRARPAAIADRLSPLQCKIYEELLGR